MSSSIWARATGARIFQQKAIICSMRMRAALAYGARGTPRIAGRLLRRVRDFASVAGAPTIDKTLADKALTALEVDKLEEELKEVKKVIRELKAILASKPKRMDILKSELEDLVKRAVVIKKRQNSTTVTIGSSVEVKHIDLPKEMQRAMAKQAEAERERRAKIIASEGEFQAAAKLADAAEVIAKHPIALQLRYLQTLIEISTEKSSTIAFPIPIDIISQFLPKKNA